MLYLKAEKNICTGRYDYNGTKALYWNANPGLSRYHEFPNLKFQPDDVAGQDIPLGKWNTPSVLFFFPHRTLRNSKEMCVSRCRVVLKCVFLELWRAKPNYSCDQSYYYYKKKKSLTQKCLSWKASRLCLRQPTKRVIKPWYNAHTCMSAFHSQIQSCAECEPANRKQCLRALCSPIGSQSRFTNTK